MTMITTKTYGEWFPHLLARPEYATLAALPFGSPHVPGNPFVGRGRDGRLRVGLICPCLVMGGAEAWQIALARSLPADRIAVVGCVAIGDILPLMADAYRGLCPVGHGRKAARDLAAECDVLVTWAIDDLPQLLEGIVPRPVIVSVVHAPIESEWGQSVYAKPQGIDRWAAVSELALAALPPPSRSVPASVIWNAVDGARMTQTRNPAAMRRAWKVPDHSPVIGYLGRLAHEKNAGAMIALARSMSSAPLPFREPPTVVIVGDGPERRAIAAEADGLENIRIVGNDARAGDCLAAFDWLVVPSDYESFGLTIAEGLWSGVPTIATESGIARMVPGLTRPIPRRPSGPAILAALRADLADLASTRRRVDHAEKWARERLSFERFGREWTDLLCSIAAPKPLFATPARASIDPVVRDKVLSCDHRGKAGPLAPLESERTCCGGWAEVHPCGDGRGTIPGRVTLADCLACRS